MNTQSEPCASLPWNRSAPAVISAGRRLFWSVRRELWENRSIYIAPLAVAALIHRRLSRSARLHPVSKMRAGHGAESDAAAKGPGAAVQFRALYSSWRRLLSSPSSTVSTHCTVNVAIAASCSGSRCRFPTSPPCSRRRVSHCSRGSSAPHIRDHHSHLQWVMLLLSSQILLAGGAECSRAMEPFVLVPDVG